MLKKVWVWFNMNMAFLLGTFGAVLLAASFPLLLKVDGFEGISWLIAGGLCFISAWVLFGVTYFKLKKEEKGQEQERRG
ncbi:hypothetical protein ACFLVS_06450 [Chloroflexota bacterium]